MLTVPLLLSWIAVRVVFWWCLRPSVADAWSQPWHRRESGIEDATAGLVHGG